MKVKRKNVFVLEDCFDASERGDYVRISRHRNTVIVDAKCGVMRVEHEMPLGMLANILVQAIAQIPEQK